MIADKKVAREIARIIKELGENKLSREGVAKALATIGEMLGVLISVDANDVIYARVGKRRIELADKIVEAPELIVLLKSSIKFHVYYNGETYRIDVGRLVL